MPARAKRHTATVTKQMTELALAVPQVVAHRVARMAMTGPKLNARDRKEFKGMVAEKNQAFAQAWQAMATQSLLASQSLAMTAFRMAWTPGEWGTAAAGKVLSQAQGAAMGILGKGVSPVHRKAVANAKRLARTKLR